MGVWVSHRLGERTGHTCMSASRPKSSSRKGGSSSWKPPMSSSMSGRRLSLLDLRSVDKAAEPLLSRPSLSTEPSPARAVSISSSLSCRRRQDPISAVRHSRRCHRRVDIGVLVMELECLSGRSSWLTYPSCSVPLRLLSFLPLLRQLAWSAEAVVLRGLPALVPTLGALADRQVLRPGVHDHAQHVLKLGAKVCPSTDDTPLHAIRSKTTLCL